MKRIAHIENNEIERISLAEDDWILPENCMLESEAISLGYAFKKTNSFKIWSSKVDFWNEFTLQEKITISDFSNPMVKFFLTELSIWNGEVWATDERVIQGINTLVNQQIISQERANEILY